jgi:NAD(P)-dependent dehydrogenase (short-subunit alcohol dehydrogenase family)
MSQPAGIAALINTNLTAALVFAGQFVSNSVSSPNAVFCAVSSTSARRPEPAIVPYAAAKAGLEALIRGMAREAAPRRAVGVAPGWIDTEMTRGFPRLYGPEFQANLAKSTPLGLTPIDSVVDAVEFLLSAKASHITGEVITVDGGSSL